MDGLGMPVDIDIGDESVGAVDEYRLGDVGVSHVYSSSESIC